MESKRYEEAEGLPFALWTAEDFARERETAQENRTAHFGRRDTQEGAAAKTKKSRKKRAGMAGGNAQSAKPLALLASAVLLCTAVLSFLTWDPAAETGELYAATAALRDTLAENEAVAVFLGLSGDVSEEEAKDPAREAEQDVRQALGLE